MNEIVKSNMGFDLVKKSILKFVSNTGALQGLYRSTIKYSENYLSTLIIVVASFIVLFIWVSGGNAWIHNELVFLPNIQLFNAGTLLEQLKYLFEWDIFDSSPDRFRPLSDFIEIIDSIMRTRTMSIFGMHQSITTSALLLSIFTGVFFYQSIRLLGLSRFNSALFVLLLLTSIAYLSCFIPYIRPAKKLGLFFTTAVILLTFKQLETFKVKQFPILLLSIFLSFFCDESGYALWAIALIFLVPSFLARRNYIAILSIILLPLIYFAMIKTIIPIIYSSIGHAGPRNGASIQLISRMLGYLLEPKFYISAFQDMSKCTLATFGILDFSPNMLQRFTVIFWAIFGFSFLKSIGTYTNYRMNQYKFTFLSALSLIAMSFAASLFDWFNSPFGYNNIGVYGYYYHSVVSVIAFIWLASVFNILIISTARIIKNNTLYKQLLAIPLVALILIVSLHNLSNFQDLNRILQILHYYPVDIKSFSSKENVKIVTDTNTVTIKIPTDPQSLKAEYIHLVNTVLGKGGESFLGMIEPCIITDQLSYFAKSISMFFPKYNVQIELNQLQN